MRWFDELDAVMVVIIRKLGRKYHSNRVLNRRPVVCEFIMPGLHLQRNRRKSAIQKIYDGRGNFNDGCVASGARL